MTDKTQQLSMTLLVHVHELTNSDVVHVAEREVDSRGVAVSRELRVVALHARVIQITALTALDCSPLIARSHASLDGEDKKKSKGGGGRGRDGFSNYSKRNGLQIKKKNTRSNVIKGAILTSHKQHDEYLFCM
jgi:hypothetical protein